MGNNFTDDQINRNKAIFSLQDIAAKLAGLSISYPDTGDNKIRWKMKDSCRILSQIQFAIMEQVDKLENETKN